MIRQYQSNNLHVSVADGTKEWGGQVMAHKVDYGFWMHLRLVWQSTNGIKVYINNGLVATFVSLMMFYSIFQNFKDVDCRLLKCFEILILFSTKGDVKGESGCTFSVP